jgi:hydrogenase maturation protease
MNYNATLIVGVGSAYGDDRLGWQVAQWLEPRVGLGVTVRTARTPIQLLVVDACHGDGPLGSAHRWRWPDIPCQSGVFAGTHDLGLVDALRLADELGVLPPEAVLFAATTRAPPTGAAGFNAPLSAEAMAARDELAARVLCEAIQGTCSRPPRGHEAHEA